MIALRYFCGFSLQIFPYAFFCLYPFRDRFRLSTKKTMLMALSIFIVMVIPFSLIAQFNIGGDYKELIWNVIFYIALLLFGVLYCFIIQAKIAEKLFVFFVVMSYGFFVTSTVTFLHRTSVPSDYFMLSPFALALTLIINLVLAKPFSHADGANPYYDQCRSGITDLEDSLLPPCFVYSDCQHCTVLKHNKSFQ